MYGIDVALLRYVSASGQKNEGRCLKTCLCGTAAAKKTVLYYSDPQRKY